MKKGNLLVLCLSLLVSCAVLLVNSSFASAMEFNDLQGNYRMVSSPSGGWLTSPTRGSIVTFSLENGEMVCRMTKPSPKSYYEVGEIVFNNLYVEDGTIYGDVMCGSYTEAIVIRVMNNGADLRVEGDRRSGNKQEFYWGMKRIN